MAVICVAGCLVACDGNSGDTEDVLNVPAAPVIGTATAGNAQATITFTAPAIDGGEVATSFTVISNPGGLTASGPASPLTVSGLTNGQSYTFTVTATNSQGTSPSSAPSNSVTPTGLPGAPVIGTAMAGNTQVSVTFSAPASIGGSPVTGYTVTSTPGGLTASGTASPLIVNGLTNGVAYTFTVTATNAVGTGAASAASNSVIPATVPGVPVIGTAAGGNAQATVMFSAPALNGGSPITGYTVTSSPGGFTATGAASPLIMTGLTNGVAYTFTVAATNAIGTGIASAASNSVTPATVPDAPVIGTATAGNTQATVTFTAPASDGGAAITGYTVTSIPGGLTASGAGSPLTVTGLTNGIPYRFTVTATNAIGTGAASAGSNSVTPATVPDAPVIGTAFAGNAEATVNFTAPAFNGGSAITGYTVTSNPGGLTASGSSSPLTVTGLTNGLAYTFTVTATNGVGTGAASAASNSVTPATVPDAPVIGTATGGNSQASVSFTAPLFSGGSTITGYTVTSSPGGFTSNGAVSPLTVTGLTNGVAYTFTVTATNAVGTGAASAASNSITPATVPDAPVIGTATAGNTQATVTFTAPASDGGAGITSYMVTSNPNGLTASGGSSPLTVTGLTNGVAYTFTVTATNAAGTGAASAASNSVTPATVPDAPVIGTATAGDTEATVSFTAPGSDGGSAITGYTVTSSPGGFTSNGAASPLTVTGLTNGVAYTFTVTATNGIGTGAASASSNSVTPVGTPNVALSVNNPKELTFSWSAVSGVTHYKLLKNPDGVSGYTQLGADLADSATSVTDTISVHLHDWVNASYIVQACYGTLCVSSNTVFTSSAMLDAIGYFKASNTGTNDSLGFAMSLSADGTTLAVGATAEDSSTTGINSTPDELASDSGAVYVFIRSGAVWTHQAYIKPSNTGASDNFGWSVSLSADGSTLAVGAIFEDSNTTGINTVSNNSASNSGAAYVFSRSGSVWSEEAYIKPSNTGASDNFGTSIALSGDGTRLVVGANNEDSNDVNTPSNNSSANSGAAYVFSRSGSVWSQEAYIKASNIGAADNFGGALALSEDGTTLAVGAINEDGGNLGINNTPNDSASNLGAVYVLTRSGSIWTQQAYIKQTDSSNTGDNFGNAVSLSADGSTLAVGAFGEDGGTAGTPVGPIDFSAANAGAAYVFSRSGTTWSQQDYLKASNIGAGDRFGRSVALSADGSMLAIGGVFEGSSTTGINSTPDEGAASAGAVYLFTLSGAQWTQQAYVKAPNTETLDSFGASVSLSTDGSVLAVGANAEDGSATGVNGVKDNGSANSGAVYMY